MAEAGDDRDGSPREPLVIRAYEPPDRDAVLALHRASFLASGAETYVGAAQRFDRLLDPVHTLVAVRCGRVVGFVAFQPLDEDAQARLRLSLAWLWARFPDRADRVVQQFGRRLDPVRRSNAVVRHLVRVDAPDRVGDRPSRRDAFVTDIAVCESERRTGVGFALLRELLHRARVDDVPRVWATAWQAGAGPALFEASGFAALIELGPWYGDGASTALMVRDCSARDPAPASDRGYPGRAVRAGCSSLPCLVFVAWLLVRGIADRLALGDPIATTTFTLLFAALAVKALDAGQRADRSRGTVYRVGSGGLEVWRGARLTSSLALAGPMECVLAAPPVTSGAGAVVIRVTTRRGSMVVGPLDLVDGTVLIEDLLLTAERGQARDVPFLDGHLAMLLVMALGAAGVVASVVVPDPLAHVLAALASAAVAAHAVRRSLRWNDGSPRALWPMVATPLLVAILWLGWSSRLPF